MAASVNHQIEDMIFMPNLRRREAAEWRKQ
jgi:hypothetical protein